MQGTCGYTPVLYEGKENAQWHKQQKRYKNIWQRKRQIKAICQQIYTLPGGSQLALTIGEDIARTGEVFCDNPIEPDVTTETPLDDALEWIMHNKL